MIRCDMLKGWKKRLVAYLVLAGVAVGVLYLLRTSPVEVHLVVELDGARRLGEADLLELKVSFHDEDGQWVTSTVYSYPPEVFPEGPPAETRRTSLKMIPGPYEARLSMVYGLGPASERIEKIVVVEVGKQETLRLRADPVSGDR